MGFDQSNIDDLLKEAGLGGSSGGAASGESVDDILGAAGGAAKADASGATPATFEAFDSKGGNATAVSDVEGLLGDVQLKVQVVLGHAKMSVDEILHLGNGSVMELDKLAGDPLDILVNDRLVARGEVLVLNENFCIRITDIIPPDDRA